MLYGICFWLLNKNKDNILLDNSGIEMFEALNPQGKLFTILEDLSTYYKISYGDKAFIIRKEAMKVIEGSFFFGIGSSQWKTSYYKRSILAF